MKKPQFSAIPDAMAALKKGKFVIIVDDEDRENEGDLVMAAEHVTPKQMALLIRQTSGIVFLAIENAIADKLRLPPMVQRNTSKRHTPFTVSIEAAEGVETGVSATDRVHTILTAIHPKAEPDDLSRPGHVFPLRAQDGGVLVRAGHTEASVDLCRLADLRPAAVGAELMHEDGTMMRLPALQVFAKKHGIPVVCIADLIAYRRKHQCMIRKAASTLLETRSGEWRITVYEDLVRHREHLALVKGKVSDGKPVLVRVHSECVTGDVFRSLHCDCGEQLDAAMDQIAKEKRGVIVYLRQEGRDIGITNKIKAYELQHLGMDTVEANRALGLGDDLREYGIGAQILKDLGVRDIRLLTNNPKKVVGLEGYGLRITKTLPLEISPVSERQRKYLKTKKDRMGHKITSV